MPPCKPTKVSGNLQETPSAHVLRNEQKVTSGVFTPNWVATPNSGGAIVFPRQPDVYAGADQSLLQLSTIAQIVKKINSKIVNCQKKHIDIMIFFIYDGCRSSREVVEMSNEFERFKKGLQAALSISPEQARQIREEFPIPEERTRARNKKRPDAVAPDQDT